MTGSADPDAYYRAVEEEFQRRRGAPMILSPRDWALIGEWREAGIPLRVVLQGIANVYESFERRAPAGRRINSLAYCRQEVLALHDLDRTLHATEAGRPAPASGSGQGPPAVLRHLGRLVRRVREAMAAASASRHDALVAALARVAAELRTMRAAARRGPFDPHRLDEDLQRLDRSLLLAARGALSAGDLRDLEESAGRELEGPRERMTAGAYATTRQALVARLLRQSCQLPRLTLFD
jgi:hypothetical protein